MKKQLLLFVMMLLPLMAMAVEGYIAQEINGINYHLYPNSKTAWVSEGEYQGDIAIPSSVNYLGTTYQVTTIGAEAFCNCTQLTSISIPNTVTDIQWKAFYGCRSLTSVTIPNSVTKIWPLAFQYCEKMGSITIPNSVKQILSEAFLGCYSLTSVIIPNSVNMIDSRAFWSCSKLKTVIIGENLTQIGDEAFFGCPVDNVYCYAERVPTAFSKFSLFSSNAILHVPAVSIEKYKSDDSWNYFKKIVELTSCDPIAIGKKNFPDTNFRTYLENQAYAYDGFITPTEFLQISSIDVSGKNISNLKGIEFFTALQQLACYENQLTTLDVSENLALKYLWCSNNQLMDLDVSKNTALEQFNFSYNQLTDIDVSNCPNLTYLCTFGNKLTKLDVSKLIKLDILETSNNQLSSLDVSKNTALTVLECHDNQLTSLDVSKNTALTKLNCSYNQLSALDVSINTALTYLDYEGNKLTSLDISKNTTLIEIYGDYNNLSNIDVSHNVALQKLNCGVNLLTSLDVSKNPNLTLIDCSNNFLTSLDVSKNTALTRLYCYGNSIYGNNMDKLVGSLPVQENAQFWVYNSDDEDEKNVCTTIQVQQANAKGWIAAYIKDGKGYRYNGSDPAAVENITVDNNEIAEVYTFDGKRIDSIQKGLNIIKMKDGTTRKIIVR